MARVSPDEVLEIIPHTTLTNSEITAHITAAHLQINKLISSEDDSAGLRKEVERWLAAHFVAISDPGLKGDKMGEASEEYHVGALGKNLRSTRWGQQAILLDWTGKLARAGGKYFQVRAIG